MAVTKKLNRPRYKLLYKKSLRENKDLRDQLAHATSIQATPKQLDAELIGLLAVALARVVS